MSETPVAKLHAWLDEHQQELLDDFREILRIPSLEADAQPNAPFGHENRRALDWALSKSKKCGMRTKDVDGYCGWAEFGDGERLVVSLGHLDVVPVSDGWKHEPFGAEIDNGYVYARGATDDKGPTIASFYAMRAIQECFPDLPARFRSVFGCNEESGFKCVARYNETEEPPTFGVAPDSDWPCIHGEKNICDIIIERSLPEGSLTLESIHGGTRPNIVIDECDAVAVLDETAQAALAEHDAWDANLNAENNAGKLTIEARGKAAHGSTPFKGDSAAIRALRFLKEIAPTNQQAEYEELLELCHIGGNGIGVPGADEETGPLTCNLGVIETAGSKIRFTFNIRYPVTWEAEALRSRCEAALAKKSGDFKLVGFGDSRGLYFPIDHPLVSTIVDVYESETGEKKQPGVMGGGTYARAMANTVSIGTGWAGDGPAHENDERLKIEHLHKMAKIYAHLFYRLGTL